MNTEPTWMAEVVFDENGLIPPSPRMPKPARS